MKGKCIMVQGTASSVGKSLLTAAIGRILKQDGYSVAPFKSQNMALNSFITRQGGEMGRAQVVQAEACGVEPTVEMNPVLLKPTSDQGSQVIVNGCAIGNMNAVDYYAYKPVLKGVIQEAYDQLESKHDFVIIEGAGSPAEINLRENDIVNMGMAEMADAPVLLVGDIDKGGVFASLAGTMMLLREDERARVKGILINKFRGDVKLLEPGLKMLEDIVHVPVLGVIPYIQLDIDDEDSVTERFHRQVEGDIDIAVIRLRRISNFTDFNALALEDGVAIRYVSTVAELGQPDAILLPGSKNTLEDLEALRRVGLDEAITRYARSGGIVFGVCGGYQMLGNKLHDPDRTESNLGSIPGLGLLDMEVEFEREKITSQVFARLGSPWFGLTESITLEGYEIHMGRNRIGADSRPFTTVTRRAGVDIEESDGIANPKGNVMGTYLHGIFDNPAFLRAFVNMLRTGRGLPPLAGETVDYKQYKQQQYDRLASHVRANVDMSAIMQILRGESL
jgi:adenosylcobyric acid synthase